LLLAVFLSNVDYYNKWYGFCQHFFKRNLNIFFKPVKPAYLLDFCRFLFLPLKEFYYFLCSAQTCSITSRIASRDFWSISGIHCSFSTSPATCSKESPVPVIRSLIWT